MFYASRGRPTWSSLVTPAATAIVPVCVLALLAWHASAFLTGVGPARLPELRLVDATQLAQLGYARAHAAPGTALVLAHDRFRQAEYELTGYAVGLLFDEYAPGWREGRTWRVDVSPGWTTLYVFDDLDPQASSPGQLLILREDPRVMLWSFDLRGVRTVEHGYRLVRLLR